MITYLQLFGGLIYLLLGGDLLVRGAAALSKHLRIPPMVVGLTVVALGTSAPELFVSIQSVLVGHPGIALGNVVGSNTANVLLVIGIPAIIAPFICDQPAIRRDTIFMLGTSVVFVALCATGELGRLGGVLLLAGLGGFIVYTYREAMAGQKRPPEPGELERVLGLPARRSMIVLFIVFGVAALPLGANLLISGAVEIASNLGVSDSIIGLTIIAIGTSLPEMATTLAAAFRRHADVAIGNVLGSNVINILAIMGTAAVLSPTPMPIPRSFLVLDLPVMLAASFALSAFTLRRAPIGRRAGIALVAAYAIYVVTLVLLG